MHSHSAQLDTAVDVNPDDWADLVYNQNIQLLSRVATAALLTYDIIITIDKEVKYYWRAPIKAISILYFLNRYLGLLAALVDIRKYVSDVTGSLCRSVFWFRQSLGWIGILSIDVILLIRVIALFSQNKKLSACLYSLFVVEGAAMLGIFIHTGISMGIIAGTLGDSMTMCLRSGALPKLWEALYWVPPSGFELILLVLAIYKAADFWKSTAGYNGFRLVNVIVRDQVAYFALVLACNVLSVIITYVDDSVMGVASSFTNATMPCILGSRILLNLREAAEKSSGAGSRTLAISDMHFACSETE